KPCMRPALTKEIEGEERAERGKANALQSDSGTRTPDAPDDSPEGFPWTGMRLHSRKPMNGEQPDQRQRRADKHQTCEAKSIQQSQANRPSGCKSAIHAHADKRDDAAGARLAHEA